MYCLPKIHKKVVPLRLILSMTGSAQHQLAQWLTSVIDPVHSLHSTHCIFDSFTFADKVSPFTFLHLFFSAPMMSAAFSLTFGCQKPLKCALMLYNGKLISLSLSSIVVELMQTVTSSVEFSFNNIMHRQIDDVTMDSPLGPFHANILVGYYKALLFKRVNKPFMYYRYVDDTFAAFNDEEECNEFFSHLNSLHSLLCFTFEKKCNWTLLFLDALVEKNNHQFVTSIYKKSTSTNRYICWDCFCPIKQKINLISTLVHTALVMCSKSTFQNELINICLILINNDYPEVVMNTAITRKINQFRRPTQLGPNKEMPCLSLLGMARQCLDEV